MRTSIHLIKGVLLVQYRCVGSLFIGMHTSSSAIYFFLVQTYLPVCTTTLTYSKWPVVLLESPC